MAVQMITSRLLDILTPPPRLNVREWADKFRYLSPESCPLPGKYRSSFAPFQRGPMEDATDDTVQSVTIMACTQLLKTTVLENLIGFFMDCDPAPILVVQPTGEFRDSFSKERISPMIRDTPSLKDKVKESRSRDSGNTIEMKLFPGGSLAMVTANSPAGLAGRPRRVVLMDEVDRYPPSAGTEGDPCSLAERRCERYWNAVIYRTSSPTIKGFSRIEKAFLQTDQRKWFCPCPKCGTFQELKWSQVLWGKERLASCKRWGHQCDETEVFADGRDAIYECESCHAHLSDQERRSMVMDGEWRPTAKFDGKRGYTLNGIATPFKQQKGFKSCLHQMVAGFLAAKAGGRETFKTWVNTFLAETFEEEADKVEHGPLLARAEPYSPQTIPDAVLLLTCSVDVQKDRLEAEVTGLGELDESWGIVKRVLTGDTEQDDVWSDLAQFLATEFKSEDGTILKITATTIDMRHKPKKVREFCRRSGIARVYPVYGVAGNQPIMVTSRFNKHYRLRTFAVNGKVAKDIIFARLKLDEPGPRYMHFPKGHGYDEEHFKQLTGEVLKTKYSHGFPTQFYEKTRDRNEALDLRVYWLAGLDILKPNLQAIVRQRKKAEPEPKAYELKPPEPPPPPITVIPQKPKPHMLRRPSGFVNKWRM